MLFQRETKRLVGMLLALFSLIGLAAAYWAVNGDSSLLRRQDNPRLFEATAAILRGAIYDRMGREIVTSSPISNNIGAAVRRNYHVPAAYSAVGYYSLRYGANGVEAAYNSTLNGSNHALTSMEVFEAELLHRPTVGDDIMLTLDLEIQERLAERMADLSGAAIVIDVPSGDVLALVSLPTYNPNTLDLEWDQLIEAPGDPFFNRVVQGRYQPGSALQTTLMAAASLVEYPFDTEFANATAPLELDGVELRCAVRLPDITLMLLEAYIYACPQPFAALADTLGDAVVDATLETFRVANTPSLPGFEIVPPDNEATATPAITIDAATESSTPVEMALGQGDLLVSPLMMALISAGIVNDGNTPQPNMLYATRANNQGTDEVGEWVRSVAQSPTFPIATSNTARRLQDFMRNAVANGAAQNAGRSQIDIGGHAALAYAGDETHVWFIGFTTIGRGRSVAIAVVVEENDDPGLAADIGGDVLALAHDVLMR